MLKDISAKNGDTRRERQATGQRQPECGRPRSGEVRTERGAGTKPPGAAAYRPGGRVEGSPPLRPQAGTRALVADTSLSGASGARELGSLTTVRSKPPTVVSDNGKELSSISILR